MNTWIFHWQQMVFQEYIYKLFNISNPVSLLLCFGAGQCWFFQQGSFYLPTSTSIKPLKCIALKCIFIRSFPKMWHTNQSQTVSVNYNIDITPAASVSAVTATVLCKLFPSPLPEPSLVLSQIKVTLTASYSDATDNMKLYTMSSELFLTYLL